MENNDIIGRLNGIENQLKFFAEAYKTLHNIFIQGVHVKLEKELLGPSINSFNNEIARFKELYREMVDVVKNDSISSTLKFMAKRLHELEICVQGIKEDGIKKNMLLTLTMDGYEMVRKKPADVVSNVNPEQYLRDLLAVLNKNQIDVLVHRYGLLGEKQKTYQQIAETLGKSAERVRQVELKALRILRDPIHKNRVKKISDYELKIAIQGTDKDDEIM